MKNYSPTYSKLEAATDRFHVRDPLQALPLQLRVLRDVFSLASEEE